MGEHHPAEKKVVVEFTLEDMPNLDAIQRSKLAKLLGVRYNPTTDIAKMSCEMYESQAQNKRYLGNTIDKLLIEARVSALFMFARMCKGLTNIGSNRHIRRHTAGYTTPLFQASSSVP